MKCFNTTVLWTANCFSTCLEVSYVIFRPDEPAVVAGGWEPEFGQSGNRRPDAHGGGGQLAGRVLDWLFAGSQVGNYGEGN